MIPGGLDSPSDVATVIVAVVVALGTIVGGLATALVTGIAWWRSRVAPVLAGLAADTAQVRHEVSANHGSSMRDAVARVEAQLSAVSKEVSQVSRDLRYFRGDVRDQQNANDAVHEDHAARLRTLENRTAT